MLEYFSSDIVLQLFSLYYSVSNLHPLVILFFFLLSFAIISGAFTLKACHNIKQHVEVVAVSRDLFVFLFIQQLLHSPSLFLSNKQEMRVTECSIGRRPPQSEAARNCGGCYCGCCLLSLSLLLVPLMFRYFALPSYFSNYFSVLVLVRLACVAFVVCDLFASPENALNCVLSRFTSVYELLLLRRTQLLCSKLSKPKNILHLKTCLIYEQFKDAFWKENKKFSAGGV